MIVVCHLSLDDVQLPCLFWLPNCVFKMVRSLCGQTQVSGPKAPAANLLFASGNYSDTCVYVLVERKAGLSKMPAF